MQVRFPERYERSTRLCVRAPTGKTDCVRKQLKAYKGIWVAKVRWAQAFPDCGPGRYTLISLPGLTGDRQVTFTVR